MVRQLTDKAASTFDWPTTHPGGYFQQWPSFFHRVRLACRGRIYLLAEVNLEIDVDQFFSAILHSQHWAR